MKPNELASDMIARTKYSSNDTYELEIQWNDGKLDYANLYKVRFGEGCWFDCKDISGIEEKYNLFQTTLRNWSRGSLGLSYYITPQHNIDVFHSKVVEGIKKCIERYEEQLKKEFKESKISLELLQEQK